MKNSTFSEILNETGKKESNNFFKPKILHVDDDKNFLDLFNFVYSKYFDISSVDRGSSAIELFDKNRFDLVFTDYEMPGMSGLELLKQIKSRHPNLPVIFYTGQGNEEVAREAFISGASDYFVKNFSEFAHKEKLVNSVKQAIEKSLAKDSLKENEYKFREIFQNLNEGITLFRIDENNELREILEANDVVCKRYGKTRKELIGSDFAKMDQECGNNFSSVMSEVLKKKPDSRLEINVKTADGSLLPIELQSHKFKLNDIDVLLTVSRDISSHKQAEKQIRHLNNVLKSLRNINQLIIREKNIDVLIENICDCLISNRGYTNAWIALIDENNRISNFRGTGEGVEQLSNYIADNQGILTPCMQEALNKTGVISFSGEMPPCSICPPVESYDTELTAMIIRLEYSGKLFGFLKVSLPKDIIADQEEETLFNEIAEDISYALYNLELEKTKARALEDLKESEERYYSIFNLANDSIFLHDAETGEVVDFNDKVLEAYGYTPDEASIFNFKDIMIDDPDYNYERSQEIIREVINGESRVFEWKARNKKGEVFWEEVSLKKVRIGKDERLISIVRNIDERKKMEIELRQSEARYRSLFRHIADGFVYLKVAQTDDNNIPTDFEIVDLNENYVKLTGRTKEELLGAKVSDILGIIGEPPEKWYDIMRKVVVDGEEVRIDYYFDYLKTSFSLVIYSPEKDHLAIIFDNIE
jgi:PAS domain S-box-containing protein